MTKINAPCCDKCQDKLNMGNHIAITEADVPIYNFCSYSCLVNFLKDL